MIIFIVAKTFFNIFILNQKTWRFYSQRYKKRDVFYSKQGISVITAKRKYGCAVQCINNNVNKDKMIKRNQLQGSSVIDK